MKAVFLWCGFMAAMAVPLLSAAGAEFIFTDAPFASAHASTVVQLRNGELMACWLGGTAEGRPDVTIWCSRRREGQWGPVGEMAREPNIATYNPVLFYTRDQRLWFYYKFGPSPSTWSAARQWSDDDGKTWSPTEHLPAGVSGPIRAKPLVLDDGTVVSGTSVESYRSWAVWIERSVDHGRSWKRIGPITAPLQAAAAENGQQPPAKLPGRAEVYGIIQPSIVAMGGRHLRMYARSTVQIGHIVSADSLDAGLTWTEARPLSLRNPNSGIDAVRLRDGRYVMVYNDSADRRTPLNVAVSNDGENFRNFRVLESGDGEFSYPALIEDREGHLDITYTWNRKRIQFVRIPPSEIPAH